jgi:AcrR family transcriptional regulator
MRSRTKILAATLELIRSDGFRGVTMAAAAQAAGVSRQTVYSIFGSREDLVSQALSELFTRTLAGIRTRLESADTVAGYVVELIVASRAALRADPVLVSLSREGDANPIHDPDAIARAIPVAAELLEPILAIDPAIEPRLHDIAHFMIRLGMSVILFDDSSTDSDDDLRDALGRWIAPGFLSGEDSRG